LPLAAFPSRRSLNLLERVGDLGNRHRLQRRRNRSQVVGYSFQDEQNLVNSLEQVLKFLLSVAITTRSPCPCIGIRAFINYLQL
jgi:hypothetical protein